MSANKPPVRTFRSSDKLPAVRQPPPTQINEKTNTMELDPRKVIKAWADSAEVLREVVEVCERNQATSEQARQEVIVVVKWGMGIAAATSVLHIIAVAALVWNAVSGETEGASCPPQTPPVLQVVTPSGSTVRPSN